MVNYRPSKPFLLVVEQKDHPTFVEFFELEIDVHTFLFSRSEEGVQDHVRGMSVPHGVGFMLEAWRQEGDVRGIKRVCFFKNGYHQERYPEGF